MTFGRVTCFDDVFSTQQKSGIPQIEEHFGVVVSNMLGVGGTFRGAFRRRQTNGRKEEIGELHRLADN